MPGADIRYATRTGESFDGYLTRPAGDWPAPGILLITAIFGVDQEMRDLADAWAADGFLVSVPDIFWRQTPGPTADITVALDRYGKFDPVQGMRDIEDLVRDLRIRAAFAGRANADIAAYPGAGHNFAMPDKPGYDAAAVSRARALRCFRAM
jgi:carboxymethylenebutenolidase